MAKLHFRSYTPNQTVLFPQRIDENIAPDAPVRIVNSIVDSLNLDNFKKLYKATGRCPYHPKMMLKTILYAYMNNIYSCRKIEQLLLRDIYFIWLAGYEKPISYPQPFPQPREGRDQHCLHPIGSHPSRQRSSQP